MRCKATATIEDAVCRMEMQCTREEHSPELLHTAVYPGVDGDAHVEMHWPDGAEAKYEFCNGAMLDAAPQPKTAGERMLFQPNGPEPFVKLNATGEIIYRCPDCNKAYSRNNKATEVAVRGGQAVFDLPPGVRRIYVSTVNIGDPSVECFQAEWIES